MKYLFTLFLVFTLSGCALFSKERLATKTIVSCANPDRAIAEACNIAVDTIEKANILAASINTAIDDSFNAKTITRDQALSYRARTKQADEALDSAIVFLKRADYSTALNKANLTKALLEALNREVAAQVAKGQK